MTPLVLVAVQLLVLVHQVWSRPTYYTPYSTLQVDRLPQLITATVESLKAGLDSQRFSSVDLVEAYLERIAQVNIIVHAVTETNPDALAIAAELDSERRAGALRGPLHGIPILIKNNIATDDAMNNTAGSYALLGAKVPRDSTVVAKLRAAGAIILGKANLSEWADYRSTNSSNGFAPYGGQVYAPYYPDEDPNGSSSGSGVASALGLALGALGTETFGSIISPAMKNNLVGIKPTPGLTSRYLVVPISEHQDTIGPMTRTVKDGAFLLQAISGVDPYDNYTSAIPNKGVIPDYVAACKVSALEGARIGIPRNAIALQRHLLFDAEVEAFEQAIEVLKQAGATIVENTDFTAAAELLNSSIPMQVLNADFLVNIATYFSVLTYNPNNLSDLADLRSFTQHFPLEDYPDRNTGTWDQVLGQGWNNTDPRFWPAYQQNLYFGGEGGLLGSLQRNGLDAVILPSDRAAVFAAVAGAPMITVPLGALPANTSVVKTSRGLVSAAPKIPFGLSFMGAKFTESKLIGYSYAFEQLTNVRDEVQPYITPNIELADIVASKS